MVTWGNNYACGVCNKVKVPWRGVDEIYATLEVFSAILEDGTVVTKVDKYNGGYCNKVKTALRGVIKSIPPGGRLM